MRPGVLGRSAGHPTLIAKSVTPKEAGGRKAVRRSAGVEGRSGAGGVSIAARARAPKDLAFEIQSGSRQTHGVRKGRGGCARAEVCTGACRQEVECTVESVPPSNTDAEHRGGLSGLSRRGGGSHSTFFPIERPMCAAAYTQLARQTSALCALGVQPRMRPDVFSCKEPTAKRYTRVMMGTPRLA
jgi:hypothetical protein